MNSCIKTHLIQRTVEGYSIRESSKVVFSGLAKLRTTPTSNRSCVKVCICPQTKKLKWARQWSYFCESSVLSCFFCLYVTLSWGSQRDSAPQHQISVIKDNAGCKLGIAIKLKQKNCFCTQHGRFGTNIRTGQPFDTNLNIPGNLHFHGEHLKNRGSQSRVKSLPKINHRVIICDKLQIKLI